MEYEYEITYNNAADRTVTVVYTSGQLTPHVRVLPYGDDETIEDIEKRIEQNVPRGWWERELSPSDVVIQLGKKSGEYEATPPIMPPVETQPTLDEAKITQIEHLTEMMETELVQGVPTMFKMGKKIGATEFGLQYEYELDVIQTRDETDITNIMLLVNMATAAILNNEDYTTSIRAASNRMYEVDAQDLQLIGDAIADFRSSKYDQLWELKGKVRDATTLEEVQSITWDQPTE